MYLCYFLCIYSLPLAYMRVHEFVPDVTVAKEVNDDVLMSMETALWLCEKRGVEMWRLGP